MSPSYLRLLEPPGAALYSRSLAREFDRAEEQPPMQDQVDGTPRVARGMSIPSAPREAWAPPAPASGASPQTKDPFCVGREGELGRLAALYESARRGPAVLALLEGPSGIGKSRILQEFRGRLRLEGGVVLDGRCDPGRAFGPFAEIVEQALRFLGEVGVAPSFELGDLGCSAGCHRLWHQHAEGGHDLPSDVPAARERRARFFEAVGRLLADVARVRPPVVLLHELEQADQGTVQLVRHLLDPHLVDAAGAFAAESGDVSGLRALFVATSRGTSDAIEQLATLRAAVRVPVALLDHDGVRALLQSPDVVARVLARTGGMPEAIELLLDAEPLTPEARLERKLGQLDPVTHALVEALAIIRRPADADLVERVTSLHVDAEARATFLRCELLTRTFSDGRLVVAFARESDRERVLSRIPVARQAQLHAACVDALIALRGDAEETAHHALEAHDVGRALPLGAIAARTLAARHAHDEAAALLERVLELASGRVPLALRAELAELHRVAGSYKRALVHAQAVRDALPEDASAMRRIGELMTLSGDLDAAAVALESAHGLATGTALAEVETLLAELHYQRASYDDAQTWAHRALDHGAALVPSLQARNTLGKVALARRDAQAAAELFEINRTEALAAGLGHQEAQALTNLGVAMLRKQDLTGAERAFSQAIEVATRANDTRDRAIATENLAVLAHLRRDYARAQACYQDAVAMLKRLGNRAMLARVANNLGELYLCLGDVPRARTLADFATHVGGAALPPSVVAEGLLLRGRIEAGLGSTHAARAAFEGAHLTFERLGEGRTADAQLELARLALIDGNVLEAEARAAAVGEPDAPKKAAEAALLRVDLARALGHDTLSLSEDALDRAERCDDDELLLPAAVRLAQAHADAQDTRAALAALERAHAAEARLAATVPADAMQLFRQRPARLELSEAETRVASLAQTAQRPSTRPSAPPADARRARYPRIVGSSAPIQQVLSLLDKAAPSDCIVLVRGESGTGKELIAEALHRHSARRDRPLVKVNCGALVETLLLSELFGHEKGAFTGASARKKGRFELADGGTLFLDEIGDISPKTQVALLRVLQEREFERVGGTQPIRVDVRIVCATHRDLEKMVREGTFREDLYYRLRGVTIELPALRQRVEDLPVLVAHLLEQVAHERNEAPKTVSAEAMRTLAQHRWPGNVRELDNVLRGASLFAETDVLEVADLAVFSETFRNSSVPELPTVLDGGSAEDEIQRVYRRVRTGDLSLFDMKKEIERTCITRALEETGGNITKAATLLGMKRPRLSQLVKQYGLQATGES